MTKQLYKCCLTSVLICCLWLTNPFSNLVWLDAQQVADNSGLQFNLPEKTMQKLQGVMLPAWESGDETLFLESIFELIQHAEIDQFAEIERFGLNNGISSIKKEFGQRILRDVEQGDPPRVSSLKLSTVVYINQFVVNKITTELIELQMHDVMQEPLNLPDTWNDKEKLFWEVHVFKNRMESVTKLTEFIVEMSRPSFEKAERKNNQEAIDLLTPVSELAETVADQIDKMLENEAELRLMELELVAATLKDELDFGTRLAAAFALELDETHLREFFEQTEPASIEREHLADPLVGHKIKALVDASRHYGKDVIEKAYLLRTGAHWWLRGRYGMAPMAFGLLKKPEAMNSNEAMFGLYMPKERPQPVNWVTENGEVSPGYERRHYFTWAVEYRQFIEGNSAVTKNEIFTEWSPPKVTGGYFW